MLPLRLDPALILSGLPRPAGSPTSLLASLTPGEAVQATVVDVLEEGMLVVLVKGLKLQASSLVGRLPVGQVFDAHVESRDGQILLRVDQPIASQAAPADVVPLDRSGRAGGLRLAALLRSLLPADEPLSGGIGRLAASLAQAVERGALPKQALAEFESLRRLILLEGQQSGEAVPQVRLPAVLSSLGLTHEAELLDQMSNQGYVSAGSVVNLKGWLMRWLEASAAAFPVSTQSLSTPPASARPAAAAPAVFSAPPVPGDGDSQQRTQSGVTQTASATHGEGKLSIEKTAGEGAPKSVSPTPASFQRRDTAGPILLVEGEPGLEVPRESEPEPLRPHPNAVLMKEEIRSQTCQAAEVPEPESGEAEKPAPPSAEHDGNKAPSSAPLLSRPPTGQALAGQRPMGLLTAVPAVAANPAEAPAAPAQEPAWVRDAQQVLTLLERTQALASLNVQSGQPFYFDLPLAWGGQGQARIYVEPRDSGARADPSQPRPYNVVTLLELDGLGTVRVDTILTGKRLSARFLLGQPEVERAVAGLLPALTRSLSAKGYQVDVVTSGTAEAGRLRGEDLRSKAAPRVNLVNYKV